MHQAPARSALRLLLALFAAACPLPALYAQRTIHVPKDAPSIQAGIDTAAAGDTVLVAPGTYLENIDFKGKAITVTSSDGPATTILDGQNLHSPVTFSTAETRASVFNGFTVQNGYLGGIIVLRSAPTITGNIITGNTCYGIDAYVAAPLIQNNIVRNTTTGNASCRNGDVNGIHLEDFSTPNPALVTEVSGNTVENNSNTTSNGGAGGPGILIESAARVFNNIVRNNTTAAGSGGGISAVLFPANVVIAQNLIYGNRAYFAGGLSVGGYFYGPPTLAVVNNVIADNTAVQGTATVGTLSASQLGYGTVFDSSNNALLLANNIIVASSTAPAVVCAPAQSLFGTVTYDNSAELDHNIILNRNGPTFNTGCADLHGYQDTSAAPTFANEAAGDFHLAAGSPGIDAGSNGVLPVLQKNFNFTLATDLDGNPRVAGTGPVGSSTIDVGPYERGPGPNLPGNLLRLTLSNYQPDANAFVTLTVTATNAAVIPQGVIHFIHQEGPAPTDVMLDPTGSVTVQLPPFGPGVHSFIAVCSLCVPAGGESVEQVFIAVGTPPYVRVNLASSLNPSRTGQAVTFTATLTTNQTTALTGNVVFRANGVVFATVPVANFTASASIATLPRGTSNIDATYNGDSNDYASIPQVVLGQPSTTTLTASATSVPANTPITLTATTTEQGGTAPDITKLQILDGTAPVASTAASANTRTTTVTFTPGTHTVTATFAGDTTAEPSTSLPLTITVAPYPTTVTLAFTPSPALAYVPILATATVSFATPSAALPGIVTFTTGGRTLGSATVLVGSPNALLQLSLPAGTYPITATYTGSNPAAASATTTATLVVQKAPVVLAFLPPLPPAIPQSKSATFNASFHDTSTTATLFATGPIVPTIDGVSQPALPLATALTYTVSGLTPGTHLIALTYPGDANFLPSTTAVIPLVILNRDFSISGGPTLTVPAQHYRSLPLTLASIGDFAGPVTLACADLPVIATCRFSQSTGTQATGTQTLSSQATITLAAGSTAPVTLTVETSALPFYMSSDSRHLSPLLAAFLAPLLLFVRRNRTGLRLLTLVLAATLVTLSGCGGKDPAFTPPGTYTIHVVGQSTDALPTSANLLHSQAVTLVVTP